MLEITISKMRETHKELNYREKTAKKVRRNKI